MNENIFDFLRRHAEKSPNKTAIISKENGSTFTQTSYYTLYSRVMAVIEEISSDTNEGDFIPIYTQRGLPMVSRMIGAIACNRCAVPLNNKLKILQLLNVLRQTKAKIVYIDNTSLLHFRGCQAHSDMLGDIEWRWLDHHAASKIHHKVADAMEGRLSLIKWGEKSYGSNKIHQNSSVSLQPMPSICLFTSGSTGAPKGVLITNTDLFKRAVAEADWYGLGSEDVLLNILPFSFDVGLNQLLSALVAGCTLVILNSWMPSDIIDTVLDHGVTGISGVPSIWQDFINNGMSFSSGSGNNRLRYITVSGGDMTRNYLKCLPNLSTNLDIFKTYGQTEAFRLTSLRPEHFHEKMESVGQPFADVRVMILRNDGTLAEKNETGEVLHVGLGAMHGYLDGQEAENKKRANPFPVGNDDSSKAIYTGDYGYLDDDNFLFLRGRMDAMLKIAGNRIYPKEIRSYLLSLEDVLDAELIVIDNKKENFETVAFFVSKNDNFGIREIRRELNQKLPSYMIPNHFVLKSALPRTSNGKPDLVALKCEAKLMSSKQDGLSF